MVAAAFPQRFLPGNGQVPNDELVPFFTGGVHSIVSPFSKSLKESQDAHVFPKLTPSPATLAALQEFDSCSRFLS